ncbi:type II secretion system F family protein [Caldisphaera lagunensis]|uniref:type II secretion system F family protein n=1 Tax=Caldisphaera lagunensis TaxID=200415 RepID=UPI001FDED2BE|nr:type II secretion system F family protein [Caldisphaera lagunensis]
MSPNIDYMILGSGVSDSFDNYCKKLVTLIFLFIPTLLWEFIYIYMSYSGKYTLENIIVASILIVILGYLLSAGISVLIPSFRYSSRKDDLEAKFHVFASTLTSLLAGGEGISQALSTFSEKYADELKEFNVEMTYIKTSTKLNESPTDILLGLSKITPSPSLKLLAQSLARGITAGADLVQIAQDSISSYLNYYYSLVERISTSIGTLLESFLVVGIVGPVLVGVMGMLFTVYPVTTLSFSSLIILVIFILIPIVSLITAVLADNQTSKLKL